MTGEQWPRGLDYDPWAHAAALELDVVVLDLEQSSSRHGRRLGVRFESHGITRGLYWHDLRRVELAAGLSHRAARSALAHEIRHALAGDDVTDPAFHREHEQRERAARAGAAWQLVDPLEYAAADLLHADVIGPSRFFPGVSAKVGDIAVDLRVSLAVVRDYLALL